MKGKAFGWGIQGIETHFFFQKCLSGRRFFGEKICLRTLPRIAA